MISENQYYDFLLIEDDLATIRLLTSYFKSKGFTSKGVSSGKDGLEELERVVPKVILLDITLPDMDWNDVVKILLEKSSLIDTPLFLFGEISRTEQSIYREKLGVFGVIPKPFCLADFNVFLKFASKTASYTGCLPPNKRNAIIKELVKIVDEFSNDYKPEYLIREFIETDFKLQRNSRIEQLKKDKRDIKYEILNKDKALRNLSKKLRDREEIFAKITIIGEKYQVNDFNLLLMWLKIVIEITDFVFGGTLEVMSFSYKKGLNTLKSTAQIVFSDNLDLYRRRFYKNKYYKDDLFLYSKEVSKGKISKFDFANLLNPQFQELLSYYRQENQKKIGNSCFQRAGIDIDFTRWLANLPQEKLSNILGAFRRKLSTTTLLQMCSVINKNQEILKFIAYAYRKTSIDEREISKITGKSMDFIERHEKIIYDRKII
jgi:CheY-like chemotaxis protein